MIKSGLCLKSSDILINVQDNSINWLEEVKNMSHLKVLFNTFNEMISLKKELIPF